MYNIKNNFDKSLNVNFDTRFSESKSFCVQGYVHTKTILKRAVFAYYRVKAVYSTTRD